MAMQVLRRCLSASIVALAIAFITVALSACSSGSGGSSTTARANDTKTYKDADYGYSFEYPASWGIQTNTGSKITAGAAAAGGVGVFDPQGAKVGSSYVDLMLVSVYTLKMTVDDSNLSKLKSEIESVLTSLENRGTDMKREKPLAQTSAAGMKGYDVTYSFTKQETPCMSAVYFLFEGNIEYQLTTQASKDDWAADQPIFDAMIASFKPGPAK
jgi:hypothetical protein